MQMADPSTVQALSIHPKTGGYSCLCALWDGFRWMESGMLHVVIASIRQESHPVKRGAKGWGANGVGLKGSIQPSGSALCHSEEGAAKSEGKNGVNCLPGDFTSFHSVGCGLTKPAEMQRRRYPRKDPPPLLFSWLQFTAIRRKVEEKISQEGTSPLPFKSHFLLPIAFIQNRKQDHLNPCFMFPLESHREQKAMAI